MSGYFAFCSIAAFAAFSMTPFIIASYSGSRSCVGFGLFSIRLMFLNFIIMCSIPSFCWLSGRGVEKVFFILCFLRGCGVWYTGDNE